MIHELVQDLLYNKISVDQGLKRAKFIADKLENIALLNWIDKEIVGYTDMSDDDLAQTYYDTRIVGDPQLPDYRRIKCDLMITTFSIWNGTHTTSYGFNNSEDYMLDLLYIHPVIEGIEVLEEMKKSDSNVVTYPLDPRWYEEFMFMILKESFSLKKVKGARQEFGKSHLTKIISLTKNKLMMTLNEIEQNIPDIKDHYKMNNDQNEKVQNIVNNIIYGNDNNVNIAAGHTVYQTNFSLGSDIADELKKLGVDQNEIEELDKIVVESHSDKPTLTSKVLKWLGSVSSSIAAKGLYDNFPAISDFVFKHILK